MFFQYYKDEPALDDDDDDDDDDIINFDDNIPQIHLNLNQK